jgi:bifunctional non-homologous end joining protein LigD
MAERQQPHPTAAETRTRSRATGRKSARVLIPADADNAVLAFGDREVRLTNLQKVFWPEPAITKGGLLQYYADVSAVLLPHLRDRAMVMKRYPNGIDGDFFFMKRAPAGRPDWVETCEIEHSSGNVIAFPVVQDIATLLWIVNLGCIDLNQWYARCDDVNRPDYLHFDLDPGPDVRFEQVLEAARVVRAALRRLKIPVYGKTTGSRGMHLYVPIVRGPLQKDVWTFAKALALELASSHSALLTAEYRVARRPAGRVLLDYNQNAWGRTLASVYSPRPRPLATVSTPVDWKEIERGVKMEDFTISTVPKRIERLGDVWRPLLARTGRVDLGRHLDELPSGARRRRQRGT